MQMGWYVAARLALVVGFFVLTATPARAVDITLDVFAGGHSAGSLNASQLGCSDTAATTAHCSVQNLMVGDLLISSLNLNLDTDPAVNAVIAVQNMAAGTQQFQLTITLLTAPLGPGGTLTGGSVAGGVTDNDGNGATLSTAPGSALYTALIDGVVHQTLFTDPTSLSVVNPFDSADLTPGAFGVPIPSLPGPNVATSIGIRYDFTLTSQDAASFTGVFVVQPIPEPASAALFSLGLGGLALLGRRRASAPIARGVCADAFSSTEPLAPPR